MDRIYKIGGHCFALPDERLMEAVDGISGFKPFVWQPDLVSAKDVYEGAWLPDFTVWEGNGWGFPAFQRKECRGLTVLTIAHRESSLAYCHRVIRLNGKDNGSNL